MLSLYIKSVYACSHSLSSIYANSINLYALYVYTRLLYEQFELFVCHRCVHDSHRLVYKHTNAGAINTMSNYTSL